MIKAILATGVNGEIGKDNSLLWHLPKDLSYFKKVTSDGSVVLMGNKTHQSLPRYPKGLPKRKNYIITNNGYGEQEAGNVKLPLVNFEKCWGSGESIFNFWGVWVIGGATIYEQLWSLVQEVHLTTVEQSYPEADTYFKPDLTGFEKVEEPLDVSEGDLRASVQVWRRVNNV